MSAARYQVIDQATGHKENVILVDPEHLPELPGKTVEPDDGTPIYAAPAPVPAMVTNFQARAALIAAGLFDQADAAVKASTNPLALPAWEYSSTISRSSPLLDALASGLGLTDAQIDDLFRQAAAINP